MTRYFPLSDPICPMLAGYLTQNKPDWSKEHDAAIRKDERKRLLKPLVAWLKQKRKNYGACGDRTANDDPEDCDPYDTVLRRVESLRQQEERR